MKIVNPLTALFAATLLLSACASSGKKISEADVSSLKKGKTTYEDALAKFGKPNSLTSDSDGRRTASYIYVHSQADAQSFIPVAGAFLGGVHTENQSLTLVFNKNNVLEQYFRSEGGSNITNH